MLIKKVGTLGSTYKETEESRLFYEKMQTFRKCSVVVTI